MNQYSILEMAREAGLLRGGDGWTMPHRWGITELERFAALVSAHERKELEQEIVRLTRVGSVSQYVQGRWDLASELQEILKARGDE
jgi:hypothetical protein